MPHSEIIELAQVEKLLDEIKYDEALDLLDDFFKLTEKNIELNL